MDQCPSREVLQRLVDEALGFDERATVEAHVESCALCQEQLDRMTSWEMLPIPALSEGTATDESSDLAVTEPGANNSTDHESASGGSSGGATAGALLPRRLGDYELLEVIGHGGMGVVFKAWQQSLNRIVAVKMIRAGRLANEEEIRRFHAEAEAAANLDHPGIVPIYEVGKHDKQHFFSMGFVEGESLANRMANGPLPPREAAQVMVQVAEAVAYAHSKAVIHRDLKPANILLASRCEDRRDAVAGSPAASTTDQALCAKEVVPRITDFGLAKRVTGEKGMTAAGQVLGTPNYMPPEQAAGKPNATKETADIYSLGATLYALLAGRPPFQADNALDTLLQVIKLEPVSLRQLNPKLPRDLETICRKCLEKEPQRRYATAQEFADELKRYLEGRPIHASPISRAERTWRWCKRNPVVATLSAITVLSLLGVAVASSVGYLVTADALQTSEKHRKDAVEARDEADTVLSDMSATMGVVASEQGQPYEAVAWFANAVHKADKDTEREIANLARFYAAMRRIPQPIHAFKLSTKIRSLSFDRRGHYLLIETVEKHFSAWDARREQPLALTTEAIGAAVWTPNDDRLTVGFSDGRIEILDLPELRRVHAFTVRGPVTALCFSPNGRHLAIGGSVVHVWDVESQKLRSSEPTQGDHRVTAVCFSSDGRKIATTSDDQQVRVFVLTNAAEPPRLLFAPLPNLDNIPPIFLDSDRMILTKAAENELLLWDANVGTKVLPPLRFEERIKVFKPSHDRRLFVVAGFNDVEVWNAQGSRVSLAAKRHTNWIEDAVFSPDDEFVLSVSGDRLACIGWSKTGTDFFRVPHLSGVSRCAFSPDGRQFATGQDDGLVRIWSLPDNADFHLPVSFPDHKLVSRRDGRYVMSSGWWADRQLIAATVYDVATGMPASPRLQVNAYLNGGAISPTSRIAVTLSAMPEDRDRIRGHDIGWNRHSGIATFWNWQTGQRMLEPLQTESEPIDAEFSPDGKIVVIVCAAGQVLMVDPLTGRIRKSLFHPGTANGNYGWKPIRWVKFTDRGEKFLTAGLGEKVQIWDTAEQRHSRPISHKAWLRDASFSHNARWLAVAVENQVEVWDLTTGEPVCSPLEHPDWVFSVVFSPDDRRILTACRDRMARLWDWRTGAEIAPLEHADEVFQAVFSSDGRWLATASRDATARVWDCTTGRPVVPPLNLSIGDGCGFGQQVEFTDDTSKVLVAGRISAVDIFDMGSLLRASRRHFDRASLDALGEIASGRTVVGSRTTNLSSMKWLELWQEYRDLRHQAAAETPPDTASQETSGEHRESDLAVLPLVDPSRHVTQGTWTRKGADLIAGTEDFSRVAIPVVPTGNYEVRVDFQCLAERPEVNLMCPVGNRMCTVYLGGGSGHFCGIHEIRRPLDPHDPGKFLAVGTKYTALVRVTWKGSHVGVQVELNGSPTMNWSDSTEELHHKNEWFVPGRSLALGCHRGPVIFHRVDLKMLSGGVRPRVEFERATELPSNQWIDALGGVDEVIHDVVGQWSRESSGIEVQMGNFSRLMVPIEATGSYALAIS